MVQPHGIKTARSLAFSRQVQVLFTEIAPWYDFLNRFLSFGRDRYWRKAAIDALAPMSGQRILDVATGTADIALAIASRFRNNIRVCGIDFNGRMLQLAAAKVNRKELNATITFQEGKGEELPFGSKQFHGVVAAFGIRNFVNIPQGLNEIYRVLRPGHRLVILEFSIPTGFLFRWIYLLYLQRILPWIGQRLSGHNMAYQYLSQSVATFPNRKEFIYILSESGFINITVKDLTGGIATLFIGHKNEAF